MDDKERREILGERTGSGGGRRPDQVERWLRDRILSRDLQPGDRLPAERRLSETLGVNRSSVREALRRLESQSLVSSRQGHGTRVLDFLEQGSVELLPWLLLPGGVLDLDVLEDLLELRGFVGELTARLAAERHGEQERAALEEVVAALDEAGDDAALVQELDMEFYVRLAGATGNLMVRLLVNAIRAPYREHGHLLLGLLGKPADLRERAHVLLDAVLARDAEGAAQAAERYLDVGRSSIEDALGLTRR